MLQPMIEHPVQKILGQLLHNETSDDGSTIHNTKYAQPIIDKNMREVQENLPHQDTYQAVVSVADELANFQS
jgi:hypothetical protein